MDYKEFYKNELFPENDVFITDTLLRKNKWSKYGDIVDPKTKFYYFDNGILGRIRVIKNYFGRKNLYKLYIHYGDNGIPVRKISDIKVAIYSYLCGQTGFKYGKTKGGYAYIALENEEEINEWRYKEYCKLVESIKKV